MKLVPTWGTVWVNHLTHILTHTKKSILQQKSLENRDFQGFGELLGR